MFVFKESQDYLCVCVFAVTDLRLLQAKEKVWQTCYHQAKQPTSHERVELQKHERIDQAPGRLQDWWTAFVFAFAAYGNSSTRFLSCNECE